MKLGIICPSEIAYRRFIPALKLVEKVELGGVAINSADERYGKNLPSETEIQEMLNSEKAKADKMINEYGGKLYNSYSEIVLSKEIEALYIPLPPALHFYWAKKALEAGKHVLVEKPSTISLKDTKNLIDTASSRKLALHENYMFIFHSQLDAIDSLIKDNAIGDVRLYRISFGFPRRELGDFRYNKELGGGALIDAGGYTIKYATRLLGETTEIKHAQLNYLDEFNVDIYGSATLENKDGVTAQVAFGMDNDYKCELEVWGSKGTLKTGRVLTAPVGFEPKILIKHNTSEEEITLPSDDAFRKSIEHFLNCIEDDTMREDNYNVILKQSQMIEKFWEMAKNDL